MNDLLASDIDALGERILTPLPTLAPGETMTKAGRRLARPAKGTPVPSEDKVQRAVKALVEMLGGKFVAVENETNAKLSRAGMFARRGRGVVSGTADAFTFWHGGKTVALEFKRPGGVVKPSQDEFLADLERRGFVCGVVTSVDEAKALFRTAGVIR